MYRFEIFPFCLTAVIILATHGQDLDSSHGQWSGAFNALIVYEIADCQASQMQSSNWWQGWLRRQWAATKCFWYRRGSCPSWMFLRWQRQHEQSAGAYSQILILVVQPGKKKQTKVMDLYLWNFIQFHFAAHKQGGFYVFHFILS